MSKESPPLFNPELRKKFKLAEKLLGKSKTRFGEPVLERNERILQTLRWLSPILPREVELAGLFYQLPPHLHDQISPKVRRIVRDSLELSKASEDKPVDLLNKLKEGHIKPSAALVHMAAGMATLDNPRIPEEERRHIGRVLADIYAPLMLTVGLHWASHSIGNTGFMHGYPEEYAQVSESLVAGERHFEEKILPVLREHIRNAGEQMKLHYEFSHRIKQPYSAFMKLRNFFGHGNEISPDARLLPDAVGMRVVLDGEDKKCYELLNKLRENHELQVNLNHDYIRNPKPNGYRSLHLNIRRVGDPNSYELQIRTHTMHSEVEGNSAKLLHHVHKLTHFPSDSISIIKEIARHSSEPVEATWLGGKTFRRGKKRRERVRNIARRRPL